MGGWPSKDPSHYLGTDGSRLLWWLPLVPTLAVAGIWFYYARWNVFHAGDSLHGSITSATCLTGAPGWANGQGFLALVGLAAGVVAAGRFVVRRGEADRITRAASAAALLLFGAWLIVVIGFDPREARGTYAGCGLG